MVNSLNILVHGSISKISLHWVYLETLNNNLSRIFLVQIPKYLRVSVAYDHPLRGQNYNYAKTIDDIYHQIKHHYPYQEQKEF